MRSEAQAWTSHSDLSRAGWAESYVQWKSPGGGTYDCKCEPEIMVPIALDYEKRSNFQVRLELVVVHSIKEVTSRSHPLTSASPSNVVSRLTAGCRRGGDPQLMIGTWGFVGHYILIRTSAIL